MIEKIELGTVNKGATPFSDDNINPTFRAPVQTSEREIICFVKLLPLNESITECICSIIGRKLGLPIPKPFLVKILPGILPIPINAPFITYASEDAGIPSFKRYLNPLTQNILISRLLNTKLSMSVGTFDEWIANTDRNLGNILYDGGDTFIFIDHGKALNEGLMPTAMQEQNKLVDLFNRCCLDFGIRSQAMDHVTRTVQEYIHIPISELMSDELLLELIEKKKKDSIELFLENRIPCLVPMLAKRLRMDELELVK